MAKIPSAMLRQIRAQKRAKEAEGELDVQKRKFERADDVEGPARKRTLKRSARRQARVSEHRVKKVRGFPYEEGDLVEIHKPPYGEPVSKGDFGMILEVFASGEWCTVQVGPNIIKVRGTALRMPWDDEDDDE